MSNVPLYRRILGGRFETLPPVLRRFHDTPGGGTARGEFHVERGKGWLRRGLAAVLGMPAEGSAVPVALRVSVEGDRERWVREIGAARMATVQWERAGLLMEAFAGTTFAAELVVDGPWLRYEFRRAWSFGVPLPRWFSPHVVGTVFAEEERWRVFVEVSAPMLGPLVRYEGWMRPE